MRATATGTRAIATGAGSSATGAQSLANGFTAKALDEDTIAQGNAATANKESDIAIGTSSVAMVQVLRQLRQQDLINQYQMIVVLVQRLLWVKTQMQ